MFGLHLVKVGKIESEFAKILTAEQEDRELSDYEIDIEIAEERARQGGNEAESFIQRIEQYLHTLESKDSQGSSSTIRREGEAL